MFQGLGYGLLWEGECIILSTTVDDFLSQSNTFIRLGLEIRERMVFQDVNGIGGDKKEIETFC